PSGGVAIDDMLITSKVKAAINADRQLSTLRIDIKTNQGIVVVSGTVPTAALNAQLLQLVAAIEGVRNVKNELRIQVDHRKFIKSTTSILSSDI
ncbi:MAG: BON domain-containing protein, partial [Burkholderiales bacterium]